MLLLLLFQKLLIFHERNFLLPSVKTFYGLLWSALEICDESVLPKLHVPLSQFSLVNGILCRTVSVQKQTVTQLVIPTSLVPSMLQLIHDAPQFGHPGRGKSLTMAHKRY